MWRTSRARFAHLKVRHGRLVYSDASVGGQGICVDQQTGCLLDRENGGGDGAITQAAFDSDSLNRLGPRAGEQNTISTWINGRTGRRSASISRVVNCCSRSSAENVDGDAFRKRSAIRVKGRCGNSRPWSWRGSG